MILKDYMSEPRFEKYREVKKYNSSISQQEAQEDLNELIYLMDNRYCGKDYWSRNGIDFDSCYEEIRNFITSNETVYISDFCRVIHAAFDIGIIDNHFSIASPFTGWLGFSKQYVAYFSELVVEKDQGMYMVIKSGEKDIPVGSYIENTNCFYRTLSPSNKEWYLVGCRSYQVVDKMQIIVNGKSQTVSLHRCKANARTEEKEICFKHTHIHGIDVLRSNACDYVGEITEDTDFIALGKKYSENKLIILNYLSNEGGYNRITREFIQGLNGYVHCEEYCAKLISPVTEGKDCLREWRVSQATPYQRELGSFDGTAILLINSDTASAGESAILYGRSLKRLILIGENSMGGNTFGNVAGYSLSHSGIILRIPNMINLCKNPDDCIEGKGFTPDYWVDSEDVQGEVISWIQNNSALHR